jgi:DNA repair protein RadA
LRLEDLPGVGPVTADKIRRAGITSVAQLAMYTAEELVELGVCADCEVARRLLRKAREAVGRRPAVKSAAALERAKRELPRLPTLVPDVDELLGGGLEPGAIYELAGEFGSGKTQFCHQLAVSVQLGGGKCFYVDTEGTFSPARLRTIARMRGLDPDEAVEGVLVAEPLNVDDLEDIIRVELVRHIEQGVKLVVVDSVIALYRAEFRGIEKLAARQQRINYLLDWLKRYGKLYSTYCVITNQVVTMPAGVMTVKVPAGGNIIAHASTHRLFLKKERDAWAIEVLDSPTIAKGAKAYFVITDNGVEGVRRRAR